MRSLLGSCAAATAVDVTSNMTRAAHRADVPTVAAADRRSGVGLSRAQERELVGRSRTGDAEAFGTLYQVYRDLIRNLAAGYLGGDRVAAEDVVSETFLVAWERRADLAFDGAFFSWLRSIARFKAMQYTWRRRKEEPSERVVEDGYAAPVVRAVDDEAVIRVGLDDMAKTVRRLPKRERAALALWLQGQTMAQIASRLGFTPKLVATLVCRARGALLDGYYLRSTSLAGLFRTARHRAGISRGELAERAGVPLDAVTGTELGIRRPSTEIALRMARSLEVPAPVLDQLRQVTSPQPRPRSVTEHRVVSNLLSQRARRRREVAAA